jgi:hypothetical protein
LATEKSLVQILQKEFLENWQKVAIFQEKIEEIAIFRPELLECHQNIGGIPQKIFRLFSMSCSQIWLNALVDDHQPVYLIQQSPGFRQEAY